MTNTSDEIYKQQGMKQVSEEDEITVNEDVVLYPELGSLEARVTKFYLDELFANTGPDLEETAYWFHTPPEGWKREPTKYQVAQEAPVTFADPSHENWEEEGRTPVEQLQEGQTITGTISDIWLFHGLQIDFDGEFDGLVPMYQDQWMEDGVREALMPGDVVVAKVHRIRQAGLYRWPVQLELLEPVAMVGHVMSPDEYEPPISHAWAVEQGMSMSDILEATGRTYEPTNYLIPQNQRSLANEMVQAFGYDVENEEAMDMVHPMQDRVGLEYTQQISAIAMDPDLDI